MPPNNKIDIDIAFTWSGQGACVLHHLYVNGIRVTPEVAGSLGQFTATVPRRGAYVFEWGLEFVGETRRNLILSADFGQTTTFVTISKAEEKKHIWTGKRTVRYPR